uniref:UDENN domain-containing protein n=1 Tax=Panagrellus redivivus TaxID=6233 RepID=A0A7E4UX22_PANRE
MAGPSVLPGSLADVQNLTLVDYFAVVGLDKATGLKLDPSLEALSDLTGTSGANERLPPLERSYEAKILAHFPEKRRGHLFTPEISSLCMPKGLRLYTEKNVPMRPQFHSFVVIKEDGTKIYGTSLTIFEEIRDAEIRQAVYDLQMDYVKNVTNGQADASPKPDPRSRQAPGVVSFGNHTMPRTFSQRNHAKRLNWNGIDLVVLRPAENELPYFDYPLAAVFKLVSIEKFIRLLTCFMLEHQILLCSRHLDRLMLVAEALTSFAAPVVPVHHPRPSTVDAVVPEDPMIPKVVLRKKGNDRNRRDEGWSMKRMSRSFDNHGEIQSAEEKFRREQEKVEGLINGDEHPAAPVISPEIQTYFQDLRLNQAIRDLLLSHFACLFYSYDNFVISEASKTVSRDSMVSFDKASFLSDQPDSFLPFLAAFLETQMFASFVDAKLFYSETTDPNVGIFDAKIRQIRDKLSAQKATHDKPAQLLQLGEDQSILTPVIPGNGAMDYEVRLPHPLPGTSLRNYNNFLPVMDPRVFEVNSFVDNGTASPWKQQKPRVRNNSLFEETASVASTPKHTPKKIRSTDEAAKNQAQQWLFVAQLLKETKTKTKRMLVMKMGKEAVHLGHNDIGITGVEENTLVAGFCDLLERVWAHGLKKKHGKSALWTHVLSHQERERSSGSARSSIEHGANLTPVVPKAADPVLPESTSLNEIIESLRALSQEPEDRVQTAATLSGAKEDATTEATVTEAEEDTTIWSKSFLRAANFIADKLDTLADDAGNQEAEAKANIVDASEDYELTDSRARRASPRNAPLPRSSSVTRFASWARNRIRDVTETAAAATPLVSDKASLPPTGRSASRVSDVPRSRPPAMHKSSSISDFAPHWSQDVGPATVAAMASNMASGGPPVTRRSRRHGAPGHERKRSLSRPRSPAERDSQLAPLPTHLAYDLKSVMEMSEIKTDIGCARAFVRLSLERKLLHKHLKTMFSNEHLLQKLYKRHAFLRSEEEREQFLYHILSLNAVDFSCFTNTFIATRMQYEVLLVANLDRFSSSSVWIMITGSLGSTSVINLPPNSLQLTFDYKNLGLLSTLRIGQKGSKPQWFLDYIIVRNNITAQSFRFNCGRKFGRDVDDGATERLLVAEMLPRESPNAEPSNLTPVHSSSGGGSSLGMSIFGGFISRPESPASGVSMNTGMTGIASQKAQAVLAYSTQSLARRRRSPSVTRGNERSSGPSSRNGRSSELHHQLGVAVNALMKHFLTDPTYAVGQSGGAASLTPLLCGENGLVSVLERVFMAGRREGIYAFFQKQYPWDYIQSVFNWFCNFFRHGESSKMSKEQRSLIIFAYQLVKRIDDNLAVGKEGKFHVFILLTLKDHILSSLLPLMVWTPLTAQLYADDAFIRQPTHVAYLSKLLASLNEFNFVLEKSLTYGIDAA